MNQSERAHLPVERFRLANGMRVILQPDRRIPLVVTHLCYLAGSRYDPPGQSGLAHVCEHMAALEPPGDSSRSYTQMVNRVGGLANGSTLHESTSFNATLPSHHLPLALWVESRRMSERPAAFTPEAIEVQRNVVLQERRQRVENRPYGRSFELLQQMLYSSEHPYRRPAAGCPEGVRAVTSEDVEAYFRAHLMPNNAILTVVGDVSPDEVNRQVERFFGTLPAAQEPFENGTRAIPMHLHPDGERHKVVADRVPFSRTYAAFSAPGYGQRGWYAASLLARSITLGRLSPLKRKLVYEMRVAQDVQSQMETMLEASTVAIVATAAPGVEHQRLEAALAEALNDIFTRGPSDAELERARNKALTDHYAVVQRLDRRADALALTVAYCDDPSRLAAEDEYYREIGSVELMDFSRDFCQPESRVVLTFVPYGEGR